MTLCAIRNADGRGAHAEMKPRQRLTARMIRDLPAPANGYKIRYDAPDAQGRDHVRGFGVCITATGFRSFVLNYRFRGREKRLTIGAVAVWTLAAARAEAMELRRMIDRPWGRMKPLVAPTACAI